MKYLYRDTEIFYKFIDHNSAITNVFLHGWGCDHKSLLFCHQVSNNNCLFVDFPPFGESGKITDWSIFTYANMLIALCQHLNLKKINLIGHSFGGRVAIIYSVLKKVDVEKLVLIDSAGLKPKRSLSYYFKVYSFKFKRALGKNVSNYGSCDYLALDDDMRKVFVSIVNTHLDDFLPYINAQTLIIFGSEDKVTPLYMAKKFHKKIKNSKLLVLNGAGHFCYIDRKVKFILALEEFLGG